jgi:hypothetical protein
MSWGRAGNLWSRTARSIGSMVKVALQQGQVTVMVEGAFSAIGVLQSLCHKADAQPSLILDFRF